LQTSQSGKGEKGRRRQGKKERKKPRCISLRYRGKKEIARRSRKKREKEIFDKKEGKRTLLYSSPLGGREGGKGEGFPRPIEERIVERGGEKRGGSFFSKKKGENPVLLEGKRKKEKVLRLFISIRRRKKERGGTSNA